MRETESIVAARGAGDGRGLATACSLARGWNGNLTVRSEPGQGATFETLIPADPGDED